MLFLCLGRSGGLAICNGSYPLSSIAVSSNRSVLRGLNTPPGVGVEIERHRSRRFFSEKTTGAPCIAGPVPVLVVVVFFALLPPLAGRRGDERAAKDDHGLRTPWPQQSRHIYFPSCGRPVGRQIAVDAGSRERCWMGYTMVCV